MEGPRRKHIDLTIPLRNRVERILEQAVTETRTIKQSRRFAAEEAVLATFDAVFAILEGVEFDFGAQRKLHELRKEFEAEQP